MATLKASPQGLIRIKRSRCQKGWSASSFRWLEEASKVLGVSWEDDGVFAAGISEGTWKRFLAGKTPINEEAFKAYCQVLEIDWQEVIEGSDPLQASVEWQFYTDWGDAPDVSIFYGREAALQTIERWIFAENCRLVTLLGMGGIGKSALAVKVAREIAEMRGQHVSNDRCFQYIIWRSLRNAPGIEEILTDCIQFFSQQQEIRLPDGWERQMSKLLDYLRRYRCLLVLDNVESILQPGDRTGDYRQGYEGYGQFLQCVAETSHQSCLLLTSREKPQGIAMWEGESLPVRSFQVSGLAENEGRQLFNLKGTFTATENHWQTLISRYSGNPLALKIVASAVRDYFDSNIPEFLNTTQQGTFLFDDIRTLLEQQFRRLTPIEYHLMYWLAIARESVTLGQLQADLAIAVPPRDLVESLHSLQRRSLIEKSSTGFTQQPVVMEYATIRFVEQVCTALETLANASQEPPNHLPSPIFVTHALLQATAKDYIRETQANLIVQPIVEQLAVTWGETNNLRHYLQNILPRLRGKSPRETGYAAGNVLNLLAQAKADLTGLDCSQLTVWQAYLQGIRLHDVDFTNSDLSRCVFTETLGNILSAAFSPNGQLLATCDTDCNVRVWEVPSGKLLYICRGHENWVRFVTFAPDGLTFASCGADETIKIWNVGDGVCIKTLVGHAHEVFAVAYSPDGEKLASASGDRTVKIWHVRDGRCLQTLSGHSNWVSSVAFSPEGRFIASSSADGTIKFWDASGGICIRSLTDEMGWVRAIAFGPDGDVLASAGNDFTIKLWDCQSGTCLQTYTGHQDIIYSVAFNPAGDTIVSGSGDRTVKFWDRYSSTCLKTLCGQSNEVCCVAICADDRTLACVSLDQTLRLWDYQKGQCLKTWYGHTDWALPVAFCPQESSNDEMQVGDLLASGSNDKSIRLWHWPAGECWQTLQGHTDFIYSLAFSPDGEILASGSTDSSIRLWQVRTGTCFQVLQGHADWIDAVAFHPQGQILASVSADCTVKLWDMRTGQCLQTLTGHSKKLLGVAFHPHGELLASCGVDQKIQLWEVDSGRCWKTLQGHTSRIWGVAFHPDGKRLASCSTDRTIKLWDITTGECLQTYIGHTNWVFAVAFSPDGRWLASAAHDRTVRIWNTVIGECDRVCVGHSHLVSAVAFHPNGDFLASGSQDQTVRIWRVKTGECIQVLIAKRLYEGMKLTGVRGITPATIATLQTLGAVV
ncbi:NB-ARC domain-containing protein [Geitlerinema sp. PCC 9228]|uniref:WD40 domain-containing protein n=1 Tax=Geitlerinema sp. PCC 9228 TaxID=111611 RepID=UPI0008F9D2EE|nr:NB-ARC domain-containing protein [Geitlerinema sp. PCC 9228]